MPDGPLFSDRSPASPLEECRTTGASGKGWDVDCVLKLLCKEPLDAWVVPQLAKATIITADSITFYDPHFDGKKWYKKPFPAGGTSNSATKKITILKGGSCEEAATTFYHEAWHYSKQAAIKDWRDKEQDAYYNTEVMTIRRKWDGQRATVVKNKAGKLVIKDFNGYRKKDGAGKWVPDKTAIEKGVDEDYPLPPPPVGGVPQPVPYKSDAKKNLTYTEDPVTGKKLPPRPSKFCDGYADNKGKWVNKKTLKGAAWKCP